MAILVYDGFDHYATQTDLQARKGALQWSDISGIDIGGPVEFTTGRGGYGRSVVVANGSAFPTTFGASFSTYLTTGFVGVATLFAPVGMPYVDLQLMDYSNVVAQVTVRFLIDGGIVQVFSGDPATTPTPLLLSQSPPNAFSPFIWNYIEIGATIGAAGNFDVHVNGNSVVSGSGLTQYPAPLPNGGTPATTFSGFRVHTSGVALGYQLDDFYLCDNTTGPGTYPCNSFLGDTAVRTLNPAANSSVQWTPLAGTNWQEVGESQFDGDASYNSAVTVGATDLFTFTSLPTTVAAVYGVQLTGAYRKQDAGPNTLVQKVVSGGTTSAGAALTLALGYSYETTLFPIDPHTGGTWTPAAVNAVIAGYELAS